MSFMGKMSSLVQCVVTRYTEFIVYFPCGIDPYHAACLFSAGRQAHHKARESIAGENNLWQKQPSTTKVLPPATFAPPGGFPRCAPAHGLCQRMPTLSAPQSPSSTSSCSPSWVTFRDPTHKSRVAVNSTKPSRLTTDIKWRKKPGACLP